MAYCGVGCALEVGLTWEGAHCEVGDALEEGRTKVEDTLGGGGALGLDFYFLPYFFSLTKPDTKWGEGEAAGN